MRLFAHSVFLACVLVAAPGIAAQRFAAARGQVSAGGEINLQDVTVTAPDGWKLVQDAASDKTLLLSFAKGSDLLALYVKEQTHLDLRSIFVNGSSVSKEAAEKHGAYVWDILEIAHGDLYLTAFRTELKGHSYYGYSRSANRKTATAAALALIDSLKEKATRESGRSLTGADYTGKKYYLGWGAAGSSDPTMMQNEVKFDVLHTHDIFTKAVGGNYLGATLVGYENASSETVRAEWQRLAGIIKAGDMYVQYSSGHGSPSGLGLGISYEEIRDNALSYPAKEIVIFTMACYSGNLVESFDQKKDVWGDWQAQGRTLFVMGSSKASETSSTGPGTDPEEPAGEEGTAGSAFGHALWKALIGHADGQVDGVKDGFLSLDEIRDFTIQRTKEIGGHTPVATGAYNGALIMNKVPSKAFLDSVEGKSSEGLSDDQIMQQIRALDAEMRVK